MAEIENEGNVEQDISESVQECQQGKKEKITVLLKATGSTPILKKRKWMVEPDRTIGAIATFMRKYLQLEQSESLFLYVNQSFAPAPDQIIKNLYDCFGSDGTLILHYCKTPAWG